jgi:glycerophosphoryl diester phosphodiesterase
MSRSTGSETIGRIRRHRPVAIAVAALIAMGGAMAASAPAADAPEAYRAPDIHAHRGGPIVGGPRTQEPYYVEEGLGAYKAAARLGFVLEVDAKLSADSVPIVIHDATLDRTTDCEGEVQAMTAAELTGECEIDLLGTDDNTIQLKPGDRRREPVRTLAEILDLAERRGARVNLEIKNVPGDPDFDTTSEYADAVVAAVKASKFPPERLIVQSFWPPNLDVIEADPYFAETPTSFLTLEQANDGGPAVAAGRGYEYISPAWPVDEDYVAEAHGLGLKVVPYTIDDGEGVRGAAAIGVDALISNDPQMARDVLTVRGDCANIRVGTGSDDYLPGFSVGEKLRGRGGDDTIKGRDGADCLKGGPGDDELFAGYGTDRVRCGRGEDTVRAGRDDWVADDCEHVQRRR